MFGIIAGLVVNFSKISLLKSGNRFIHVQNDFTELDSCIFKLYNAENNCRMYVIVGERDYYTKFLSEVKEFSSIVDKIEELNQSEQPLSKTQFNNLIKQKKLRTAQFIVLKRLADSLLSFSVELGKNVNKIVPVRKLIINRKLKTIIKFDTLKSNRTSFQSDKNYFNAINTNAVYEGRPAFIRDVISPDSFPVNSAYQKMQFKAIDNYIRLYNINKKLKSKEKKLLNVNHLLISTILNGLKQYKLKEKDYYSSIQHSANVKKDGTVENLDKFTVLLLVLATGLSSFVFYMVYNFYRNEQELIDYSKKAELNALSKSRFLANMSHEIRTPLNCIIGFSEQLTQVNLEEKQKEQVGLIKNSSVLLLDVVNDILDFSKYETGKVNIKQVAFSPLSAIQDVFDGMKIQADRKKIGFIKEINIRKDIYLLGDPLHLKQVVMNLLSNAIKFTVKGHVSLKAELIKTDLKQTSLKVSISDTGTGIKPQDQQVIFDEFAQADYSSTRGKQQGTGLGLAICKKIIEFQGGIISVNSEETKGSVFSFELPYEITKKPPVTETNYAVKTEDVHVLKDKRILLVDDNVLNILLAGTILKKYKINFDSAHNGFKACELFNENDYDIIVTDIQMPEMCGIELTRLIRGNENTLRKNIPILGLTANVMPEDRKKYIESGINELVLKPFLEKELIEKLIQILK
ncbi:ATP-binding protein [Pedobacter rhodius]|uniref:histidine kinase n=1 Tax=Pedobacter rhodius TaxID=3004098 RepID=A0ABT4L0C4_9SPHI|nr:ATP-binding protein [Pedobacter sp. SJ11]MCZ4224630.1 ATP-binding protein [Pedobacter sp. SJ11]